MSPALRPGQRCLQRDARQGALRQVAVLGCVLEPELEGGRDDAGHRVVDAGLGLLREVAGAEDLAPVLRNRAVRSAMPLSKLRITLESVKGT